MAGNKNKYGLSRAIPAPIKRKVRERSKYGCVVCRNAIYEYEHIDPTWADAQSHDPNHICLLCGTCHSKVTKGHLAKSTVLDAYKQCQSNNTIAPPFSDFDLRSHQLTVKLGSCRFLNPRAIITIDGLDLIALHASNDESGFPVLSGRFCDETGNEIFAIEDNEWQGPLDCWDMDITGSQITVRTAPKKVALRLNLTPPNMIEIVEMDMRLGSCRVAVKQGLAVLERTHNEVVYHLGVSADCQGADSCMSVNSREPAMPSFKELKIVGGEGTYLHDCGVHLGKGNGSALIRRIETGTRNIGQQSWKKLVVDFTEQKWETVDVKS